MTTPASIGIPLYFKTLGKIVKAVVPKGTTVLEAAHSNKVNLEGACEGSLACSTCHVILDKPLYDRLPEPSDREMDLLDQAFGLRSTSRLGCQLVVDDKFCNEKIELPRCSRNLAVDGYISKHH